MAGATVAPVAEAPLDADALGMGREEMRRLGYWVVDSVVEHVASVASKPAIQARLPGDLLDWIGATLPVEGADALESLELLRDVVLENMQHGDHPRYFARVPGPSSFTGIVGDWIATGFNAITASWAGGSGPTTVELVVIEWLRTLLGMPAGTEGVLASGGSMANLLGLLVGSRERGHGVVYLSDQTHASITRDLLAIGFTPECVRVLSTDATCELSPDALRRSIEQDRSNGEVPILLVGNGGTTNTGTVDPLDALADIASDEGMWFHVDAAYGGPAALCEPGRARLAGLERADSVVLDPHKWLFQPYDIGCVLVRHPGALERTFSMSPEYLLDANRLSGEVDMRNRTLELTRPARALKLWLTLRVHGVERIASAIQRGIDLAETAESILSNDPRWIVVTPAQLGIVTFVGAGARDGDHAGAAAAVAERGFAAVTSTTLHGRSVLRLCTINPRTTEDDLQGTLDVLAEELARVSAG